jgi:hypothetical protein
MRLVWSELGGYVAREGRDDNGRFYAKVQGVDGRYGIYFAPWACGHDGGLWLDGFATDEEAMVAADRYVADYLDSGPAVP